MSDKIVPGGSLPVLNSPLTLKERFGLSQAVNSSGEYRPVPDLRSYSAVCVPEKPQAYLSKGLYWFGEKVQTFLAKEAPVDPAKSIDTLGNAGTLGAEAREAAKVGGSIIYKGLKKFGSFANVVTGLGDAALEYKKSVDTCSNRGFDVGYSLSKSAVQVGASAATVAGIPAALAFGSLVLGAPALPAVAVAGLTLAGAYAVGTAIDYAFGAAKPYAKSFFVEDLE